MHTLGALFAGRGEACPGAFLVTSAGLYVQPPHEDVDGFDAGVARHRRQPALAHLHHELVEGGLGEVGGLGQGRLEAAQQFEHPSYHSRVFGVTLRSQRRSSRKRVKWSASAGIRQEVLSDQLLMMDSAKLFRWCPA